MRMRQSSAFFIGLILLPLLVAGLGLGIWFTAFLLALLLLWRWLLVLSGLRAYRASVCQPTVSLSAAGR